MCPEYTIDSALLYFGIENEIIIVTMSIFQSEEQIYAVLQAVFEQLTETAADIEAFTHSNLVIRILLENPNAEILLDGRQPPLEVFYGSAPRTVPIWKYHSSRICCMRSG